MVNGECKVFSPNEHLYHVLSMVIVLKLCDGKRALIYPLSPHDALKHHFTSLKADLIFLQQRDLERKFQRNWLPIHGNFL